LWVDGLRWTQLENNLDLRISINEKEKEKEKESTDFKVL
jgi:hypothetical protein